MNSAIYTIPGTDTAICIKEGDLFKQEGLKIVHCPWTFDTSEDIVPVHSVFGKFLKLCHDKAIDVDTQIDSFCRNYAERARRDSSREYRKLIFEVGEVFPIFVDDEQYCIAAFSNTDSVFSAKSLKLSEYLSYWENLWHNLTNLTIERKIVSVAVPGDRLVNISAENFPIQQKVAVIVNTFLHHNKSAGICKQLNVCLYGRDAEVFDYKGWETTLLPFLSQMAQLPFHLALNKVMPKEVFPSFTEEAEVKDDNAVDIEALFIDDLKEMVANIEKHLGEEYAQYVGNKKIVVVVDAQAEELKSFIEHFQRNEAIKHYFIRKHGVKYDKNKMFQLIGALHDSTTLFGSLNRRSVIKLALDEDGNFASRWPYLGDNIDNIINYVGQRLADLKKNNLHIYNSTWRMVPVPFRNLKS